MHGVLGVVPVGGDQLLPATAAPAAVTAAPQAQQPQALRPHVPLVAGHDVAPDERRAERPELLARGRDVPDRRPQRHQHRRVPGRRQPDEAAQRVQRPVDVAGAGSGALGLRALHDRAEAPLVEADHLLRRLDHHAHLVQVLAAGQPGAVGGGAHLHEQDGRAGQRRDVRHPLIMPAS